MPSTTVTWFSTLSERVVNLGDDMCHGVSQVDKLSNSVHSYIWKDPKYGKDRAYRWMVSWIGAKCAVTLGVSTYRPAVSWEVFSKAFQDQFDPEGRECVRQELGEQIWQCMERQPLQQNLHQHCTHFGQDKQQQRHTHFKNDTDDKVAILEKRVVLLERHIM
ncbi:hypothetical protein BDD12DRAFT_806553 [Trichophaea hybrida]|nr:hypothetical protein BDD12DRAFT_806553 [Trichophaea hybrida]